MAAAIAAQWRQTKPFQPEAVPRPDERRLAAQLDSAADWSRRPIILQYRIPIKVEPLVRQPTCGRRERGSCATRPATCCRQQVAAIKLSANSLGRGGGRAECAGSVGRWSGAEQARSSSGFQLDALAKPERVCLLTCAAAWLPRDGWAAGRREASGGRKWKDCGSPDSLGALSSSRQVQHSLSLSIL